jgi:hypothetical protein
MQWMLVCWLLGLDPSWSGWNTYSITHIEGHLASLQCKHVSKNIMVPSVSMLYPNWIIQFQQDRSYIYSAQVVQNGNHFRPMIKKTTDCLQHVPEMNPTQNMQSGKKKKTIQENWSILPSRKSDVFWTFVSDTCWRSCLISTLCLIPESMQKQMWSMTKALGFCTSYLNSPLKD